MALPKIPKLIELLVDGEGIGSGIRIDGNEFPYAVGENVTMEFGSGGRIKTMHVALFADDIRIVNV